MSVYARERAHEHIAALAVRAHDLVTFWQESTEVIARVVPNYQAPCWYTLDPASLLITSHFNDGLPQFPHAWLASEYYEDDVNKLADVARSTSGISTLHGSTGGDPSASPRWQRNIAFGGDQELIAALRAKDGEVWGALGLYRETGQPLFDEQDLAFVRVLAPHLADGARRALLMGEATDPEGPDAPGLIVVTEQWEIESATPGVEQWLCELPDGDLEAGRLPSAVLAVAGQALRGGEVAVSRVLSRSGTWVVLHGAALISAGARRVAVIVEPAHPARITPLLMSAYGLSDREQEITRLVLQGNSTTDIATQLTLSAHTVQQHLKSVFDKTGVRSRRDLVGKVFFAHYEPRVRDNERRVVHNRPLRGGPFETDRVRDLRSTFEGET